MFKKISKFFAKNGGYFDRFADLKSSRLEEKDLNDQLKNLKLDDWKYDKTGNRISKSLSTKDYKNSKDFVQAVNGVAQRIGAKAEINQGQDSLDISLNSPDLKGVSNRDLGLASSINRLEKSYRDYLKEGANRKDYKLELSQQDEEEIFNSLSGAKQNENKGYGNSSAYSQDNKGVQGDKGQSYGQSYGQNQPKQQAAQNNSAQGSSYGQNNACSNSDKDHRHDKNCGPDGYNNNKDARNNKNVGQDSLNQNARGDQAKTSQADPSKFGQDSDNKPQSSFGRYGSKDSTLADDHVDQKTGQGSYDTVGQSAKSVNSYDKTQQNAYNKSGQSGLGLEQDGNFKLNKNPNPYNIDSADKANLGSANAGPQTNKQKGYEGNTYPGSKQNQTNLQGDQSQEFQSRQGQEGSQGRRTSPSSDTIANKDFKSSQHEATPSQFTNNNQKGDLKEQNNQYRDSTAKFYSEQSKTSGDNQQVNNTSYKANQDSAHPSSQNNLKTGESAAQRSGQESKYGKGSESNQGVHSKDKVGTEYPNSQKDNKPKDSENNRTQSNREETSKTNARQNQVQDETNKKRDNNDSNEFPNPRDRQDGVRPTTLKEEKNDQSKNQNQSKDNKNKQNENSKTSTEQKKDQDRFNGNQDKAKQANEKSYK